MEENRVPAAVRILIAVSLPVINFLVAKLPDFSAEGERNLWIALATSSNRRDIEGFVEDCKISDLYIGNAHSLSDYSKVN